MENKEKGISLGLLIALVGFPQISETIYTPALPDVANGLMSSPSMIEATLAIYFFGFAFGVLSWGTISDFYGRRPTMLIGLFVYVITSLGCANVASVETLLAWRFFQAFGASVGSVITQTILRDSYDGAKRIKLFSVVSGALAFSPAVGPLLGGFISELLGWRANFWVLTIFSLILYSWTFFALKETRPKQIVHPSMRTFYNLFIVMATSRQLLGHVLLIAGTNGILFGFYQEAPFVFIEQLGMQPKSYGCFGLLIAVATLLAARVSYRQSSHFSSRVIIQWGSFCVLGGGLIITSLVLTGVFALKIGLLITVFTLFLIFFGIGLIIPNSLSHALKTYQHVAGSAGSIFGGCYYFLIAVCTWFMSALHNDTALPLPFYISILGVILIFGCQMIRQTESLDRKVEG